jgi:hypothetical protein
MKPAVAANAPNASGQNRQLPQTRRTLRDETGSCRKRAERFGTKNTFAAKCPADFPEMR